MHRISLLLLLLAGACVCAIVHAQKTNDCAWGDLARGADQANPDRPCRVQYTRAAHAQKLRRIAQAEQRGEATAQQAAQPYASPDRVTAAAARKANLTSMQLLAIHGSTSPGADVLLNPTIKAIFWGPSWANPAWVGDKISGMDQFFKAHNNSGYGGTCSEYSGANGNLRSRTTYTGHIIDPSSTAGVDGQSASVVLDKICALLGASAVADGFYALFTDVPRGDANFCAWHWEGYCGGVLITYAFFFDLTGDGGCDPRDATTGHSQGLAALANVAAHELEEARTDPYCCGWWDSWGAENGDKCAWSFPPQPVTLADGSKWKLQVRAVRAINKAASL